MKYAVSINSFLFVCSIQFDGPTWKWLNMADIASCSVSVSRSLKWTNLLTHVAPMLPMERCVVHMSHAAEIDPTCFVWMKLSFISMSITFLIITGSGLQRILHWSMKCHYLILRLVCGVLQVQLGIMAPFPLLLHQKFTVVRLTCIWHHFMNTCLIMREHVLWARQSNSPECKQSFQLSPECFWWWNRQFLLVRHVKG